MVFVRSPSSSSIAPARINVVTQYGSAKVSAEPNQMAVDRGTRETTDTAKGIMLHVGGNYQLGNKNKVASSLGCFGICNTINSAITPSNKFTTEIINKLKAQADKSKTDPGHIRVIIEKREGNEFPEKKKID